jgi:hypothetical protein
MYGYINVNGVKQASASPTHSNNNISLSDINMLLDKEVKHIKIKWSKLLILDKIKKINSYITDLTIYNETQKLLLKKYIRLCINRKKLARDKDVKYNSETGRVECINGLLYNETSKKFTLSNNVSKTNTKTNTTIKNKSREIITKSINGKQ